jgi:hypothetical protein
MYILFFLSSLHSYTWQLLGGAGNSISGYAQSKNGNREVFLTTEGFYLQQNNVNFFFSTPLPPKDVMFWDEERVILLLGNGSEADGIYLYYLPVSGVEFLQALDEPGFLRYDENGCCWYATSEEGLYASINGISWFKVSNFNNLPIHDVALNQGRLLVSAGTQTSLSQPEYLYYLKPGRIWEL